MIQSLPTFVLAIVVAGGVAAVLHELTHYAVATIGGREAWIDWRELNQRHYYPRSGPDLVDRLVGIAPLGVGTIAGLAVLAVVGPDGVAAWAHSSTSTALAALVGWGVYTLNGIPNDFRL